MLRTTGVIGTLEEWWGWEVRGLWEGAVCQLDGDSRISMWTAGPVAVGGEFTGSPPPATHSVPSATCLPRTQTQIDSRVFLCELF